MGEETEQEASLGLLARGLCLLCLLVSEATCVFTNFLRVCVCACIYACVRTYMYIRTRACVTA